MEAALAKLEMVVYILGKLIETLATPKEDVKAYPKNYKKNSRIHWFGPTGWNSRITKATGTTIVINEDPITEERRY
jgi:polyribonucleotide nucleotidyltransferase